MASGIVPPDMNDLSKIPTEQLRAYLKIREQQDRLKAEERRIMGGSSPKPKKKLSAATRKKIADKVKARWAERKASGKKRL